MGGQARNFPSPFWAKKGQNFFPKFFFLHYFDSQRVWDPQNPKIDPVDPPVDPILAQFVGKKADFGVKIAFFSKKLPQIICYRFPDGLGPSKTQNWPFIPPTGPHFGGKKADFGAKKPRFSPKNIAPNHFLSVPRWSGTFKNPNLALYTPQSTPFRRAPALPVVTQPAWSRT